MFDIRDHGGVFGSGKYSKYSLVDINNLSYPKKFPSNQALGWDSSYTFKAIAEKDGYLYMQCYYSSSTRILKYQINDDGDGGVSTTLIRTSNLINGTKITSMCVFVPNTNYFVIQTDQGFTQVDKDTLEWVLIRTHSNTETAVDAFMLDDTNMIVVLNPNTNSQKYVVLYDLAFNQLRVFSAYTTFVPVRFPNKCLMYQDSGQKIQLYDPETNTLTEQSTGMVGGNGRYETNAGNYGISVGTKFFVPYLSSLYVFSVVGKTVTYITALSPFVSKNITGLMQYDDTHIYVHTDTTLALIDINTYAVTTFSKPMEINPKAATDATFVPLDLPKAKKTFLYNQADGAVRYLYSPIFKTQILK